MNSCRRLIVVGLSCALFAAACAETDSGVSSGHSDGVSAQDSVPPQSPPATPPGTGADTVPATEPPGTAPPGTVPTTDSAPDPTNPVTPPSDPTLPAQQADQVIDFGEEKSPRDYDEYLNAAFADIISYWDENYPAIYGSEFVHVSGIYAHYPDREDLPVDCEGLEIPYEYVEMNAFYYACEGPEGVTIDGDVIVYDDQQLLPDLVDKLGIAAVAIVAAHEFGHAVQARAGTLDIGLPTVDTEQQADCFAGAWTAHVARGESALIETFGDEEIKGGLAAMIEVRDPVGSDPLQAGGHGTAFDRVGAFQEGFIKGPERCADFVEHPNPRIDLVFTELDVLTGGNLTIEEVLELIPPSFDIFWLPTLEAVGVPFTPPALVPFPTDGPYPECAGLTGGELKNRAVFCPESNTIAYDEDFVLDLYDRLGDVGFTYPLAVAYSDAVQKALGFSLTGEPEALLNDCLVGAWLVDIVPVSGSDPPVANNPNQEILLSAGDLDEVVLTAILFGDAATDTNVVGTAFEKIDAFRAGVLDGLPGCQARLG